MDSFQYPSIELIVETCYVPRPDVTSILVDSEGYFIHEAEFLAGHFKYKRPLFPKPT